MPDLSMLDDVVKIAVPTVTAALLGGLFTLLPSRLRRLREKKKGVDMLKAQVLFCTAGAMLVVIIGTDEHSAARAFGLLGLGSFIRFRTVLKNPTDTAVFFILIGIGMACGLGRPAAALFGTLFLMLVLTVLERLAPHPATAGDSNKEGDD
jgi:uncharacterized membrane protein YhiD involved in acid resistance